jgi:hypothetical protein
MFLRIHLQYPAALRVKYGILLVLLVCGLLFSACPPSPEEVVLSTIDPDHSGPASQQPDPSEPSEPDTPPPPTVNKLRDRHPPKAVINRNMGG